MCTSNLGPSKTLYVYFCLFFFVVEILKFNVKYVYLLFSDQFLDNSESPNLKTKLFSSFLGLNFFIFAKEKQFLYVFLDIIEKLTKFSVLF